MPSGDMVMFVSAAGVVHTADAGLPSIGTRQRSPVLGIISARPSALQNAPFRVLPAPVSSRGRDADVAEALLMEASAT